MSFEPRIYHQQNHSKDNDQPSLPADSDLTDDMLSEDLDILAQQLSDDADYLSARYPADGTSKYDENFDHSTKRSSAWRWISIAAGLLMMVGVGSWYITNHQSEPQTTKNTTSAAEPVNVADSSTPSIALEVEKLGERTSELDRIDPVILGTTLAPIQNKNIEPFRGFIRSPSDKTNLQFSPAMLLQHLSAPEQEAFMDLLGDDEEGMYEISL